MTAERMLKLVFSSDGFATLTLNRPKVHNALSDVFIGQVRESLAEIRQAVPRALFLRAEGKSFSAGADLEWMKRAASYSKEENFKDAMELSGMLNDLSSLPFPSVGLIQGAALGGGVGLVAACDISVSVKTAKFTLSEVKLGLVPATIAPYVIRRIGEKQARRYFLTAERFDAYEARRIGLLHEVVEDEQGLSQFENWAKSHFCNNAPGAMAACKDLISTVVGRPVDSKLLEDTATLLANQRDTQECRDGIAAFFEKKSAPFVKTFESQS